MWFVRVFALCLGLLACGLVYDGNTNAAVGRVASYSAELPQEQSWQQGDALPVTSFIEPNPAQGLLSRIQRVGALDGFNGHKGRAASRLLAPWVGGFGDSYSVSFKLSGGSFPSPLAYGLPKDYYVYTLERMLC